jgi:hydrogenase-4 component B
MVILAAACLIVALAAPVWPIVLRPAAASIAPVVLQDHLDAASNRVALPLGFLCAASWGLLGLVGTLAWARKRLLDRRGPEKGPTWDCGYAAVNPRMQYTASSFAGPLVSLFRMILRPRIELCSPA